MPDAQCAEDALRPMAIGGAGRQNYWPFQAPRYVYFLSTSFLTYNGVNSVLTMPVCSEIPGLQPDRGPNALAWWPPEKVLGSIPVWCVHGLLVDGLDFNRCKSIHHVVHVAFLCFVKDQLSNRDARHDNLHVLLKGRANEVTIRKMVHMR